MATVPSQKRLFPIIHCICPREKGGIGHALANTKIALENGADGVFLIGHGVRHQDLICIYDHVRKQYPNAWIGVNFLDLTTNGIQKEKLLSAISECTDLSAVWMDALPSEELNIPPWIEIFAGVAFKYRNARADGEQLALQCDAAVAYANFATTSGEKTGSPPSISKLAKIHSLLAGRKPLAVSSGVNALNASEMLPYVDAFLVALSICSADPKRGGHEYLVPEKVAALGRIIHQ